MKTFVSHVSHHTDEVAKSVKSAKKFAFFAIISAVVTSSLIIFIIPAVFFRFEVRFFFWKAIEKFSVISENQISL